MHSGAQAVRYAICSFHALLPCISLPPWARCRSRPLPDPLTSHCFQFLKTAILWPHMNQPPQSTVYLVDLLPQSHTAQQYRTVQLYHLLSETPFYAEFVILCILLPERQKGRYKGMGIKVWVHFHRTGLY